MGGNNSKASSIVSMLAASNVDLNKEEVTTNNAATVATSHNASTSSNIKKEHKGKNKDAFIRDIINSNIDFASSAKKSIIIPQDIHDKIGLLSSLTNIKQQDIVYAVLSRFFEENEKEIKNLIKDFI